MLLFLPVIFPVVAGLGVLVLQRVRPSFGVNYLLSVLFGLANWAILVWFRWAPPPPVALANWLPVPGQLGPMIFQFDQQNWPYAFALAALAVGVLLTASARLALRSIPAAWAGTLVLSGTATLTILASSPLALAVSWTILDAMELGIILSTVPSAANSRRAVLSFSARLAGTFFLVVAMSASLRAGSPLILIDPAAGSGVFLLLAAGLRLGVLPVHLPYTAEIPLRRGLGTFLRLASPASSLLLLSRLPQDVVPVELAPLMLIFAALAAFYGSAMWLTRSDEVTARPYWMIAVAGMAVACAVRGYPLASVAWGVVMILSGGMLFLYSSSQGLRTHIAMVLGFLALSGLPFTPAASGWEGLVVPPINAPDLIFIAAHALLLAGYLRHLLRPKERLEVMERWIGLVYPLGLYLIAASTILVGVTGWTGSLSLGVWWASLVATGMALGGWLASIRFIRNMLPRPAENPAWYFVIGRRAGTILSQIFSLGWFYRLLGQLFSWGQSANTALTRILEGEGGVLWALVLLALLISFIGGGGQP